MKLRLKPGERRRIDRGIEARGRSDGTVVYGIRLHHYGREIRQDVGPRLTDARRELARKKVELAEGRLQVPGRAGSMLGFRVFSERYLDHARTNKASWRIDEERLKSLAGFFGDRRLAAVTPWQIEQYKAARREQVSPRTVNIELSILRRMFGLAQTWGLVPHNPVLDVKRFREVQPSIRVLTREEEARLLEASPPHLGALIVLGLNTGLRLGEMRALRRADVRDGLLTVRAGKTGKIRAVPLNAAARAVVAAAAGETILSYRGRPIGRVYRTWYRAIRKANLPGLRIHDLRHTFASRLVAAGVDLATVRDLLGHSTLQMTSRYSHSGLPQKIAATAILDEMTSDSNRTRSDNGPRPRRRNPLS